MNIPCDDCPQFITRSGTLTVFTRWMQDVAVTTEENYGSVEVVNLARRRRYQQLYGVPQRLA